ncbi:MAG: LruC domain-containing protein [Candidatus Cloacimonetes bacterium]|nr:LruC domain-containing protein [Candidatus Cloacimonadota bacterium]
MKKILITLCLIASLVSLFAAGGIVVWGSPHPHVQSGVPAGEDFIAIDGGKDFAIALKSDGSLVAWGANSQITSNVPSGTGFTAISAGEDHALALKSDGSIVAWGKNNKGQATSPTGTGYTAISAGIEHNLAIKSDGTIYGWGNAGNDRLNIPAGTYRAIAAGNMYSIAIKSNGELVGWGSAYNGELDLPAGNDFIEVKARFLHAVARKSDGSLVGWGNNYDNANAPSGTYKGYAVGWQGNIAIKSDDYLYSWGNLWMLKNEQMPQWVRDLGLSTVAAGDKFFLGITSDNDRDGDGVANDLDAYPDDPDRAYNMYYPQGSADGWGTLAFEDLWPQMGDYDFNDLVMGYQLKLVLNAQMKVKDIIGSFLLKAVGASYQNAFAIEFPFAASNIASLSSLGNGVAYDMPITEAGAYSILKVISNTSDFVGVLSNDIYWNTQMGQPHYPPIPLSFELTLDAPLDLNSLPEWGIWNPFLQVNRAAGHEIHLPGYPPTMYADETLFGTLDDDTNLGLKRYYLSKNNLPWALDVPYPWKHPQEHKQITHAYLGFTNWAQSGGNEYQNWYELIPAQVNMNCIYNP